MSGSLIALLALFSVLRVTTLTDGYADDNCWLLVIQETRSLDGFLAHSFGPLHRDGQGVIFYGVLSQFDAWYFPLLWHGVNLLTEIGSPLVLYAIVKRDAASESLGVLSAVALIALHGDHTIGYISGINYRLGVLLTLLSFWLMERWYWTAVGCAVLAMWGCTETAVGVEIVRWLLIGTWRSLPFQLSATGLVAYKLLSPAEGMYTGAYAHPQSLLEVVRLVALWPYKEVQDVWAAVAIAEPWTWLYGMMGGCTAWVLAKWWQDVERSSVSRSAVS